jgi:predicted small metal-binding protein
MPYTDRCGDYPGMEACLASFTAESTSEVMKHVELHAEVTHGEDPKQWSQDDRNQLQKTLYPRRGKIRGT